jgi:hypothetical protein
MCKYYIIVGIYQLGRLRGRSWIAWREHLGIYHVLVFVLFVWMLNFLLSLLNEYCKKCELHTIVNICNLLFTSYLHVLCIEWIIKSWKSWNLGMNNITDYPKACECGGMAEWLMRRTGNLMITSRIGSNPVRASRCFLEQESTLITQYWLVSGTDLKMCL